MPEFFQGWKRKVGVVTLVIACVFAAAWIRSLLVKDRVILRKLNVQTAKNKQLVGLETTPHSLIVLGYKVETYESRHEGGLASYSLMNSPDGGEPDRVEEVEKVQPVANNSPVLPNGANTTGFSLYIPFPKSLIANPPAACSIRPISTDPLVSALTAVYEIPLVVVPYWSIVIPLTLISAYLLLSRPQVPKPVPSVAGDA